MGSRRDVEKDLDSSPSQLAETPFENTAPDFIEQLSQHLHVSRSRAEERLAKWLATGLQEYLVEKHFGCTTARLSRPTVVRKVEQSGANQRT